MLSMFIVIPVIDQRIIKEERTSYEMTWQIHVWRHMTTSIVFMDDFQHLLRKKVQIADTEWVAFVKWLYWP